MFIFAHEARPIFEHSCAEAVLAVVQPLPCVRRAVSMLVSALACCPVVFPVSTITVAVRVHELSKAVRFVFAPLADVLCAVWPRLLATPTSGLLLVEVAAKLRSILELETLNEGHSFADAFDFCLLDRCVLEPEQAIRAFTEGTFAETASPVLLGK